MGNGRTSRLSDVADGVIRPLNQTELKAAVALLKDLTKQEPALAEHLAAEGPLRQFVLSAFTLSPYLRDVANLKPSLLLDAVSQPLEPQIVDAIEDARYAWRPDASGAAPAEAEVMARLRRAKRKVAFL
ncbi:MAG: bifunctional [glutamine synthetase] adenylyltransferase/[glutamine synthetase]-adenylyl-L-tyrosine phosphorylase, partial [Rhizobium sp.]|nr:bifunctional [glutamine synthetase] adenylyltransferase/[glutamine synthetase]-adenylyl-L-tyrosine phosphorylase [Rhizobium sp.]